MRPCWNKSLGCGNWIDKPEIICLFCRQNPKRFQDNIILDLGRCLLILKALSKTDTCGEETTNQIYNRYKDMLSGITSDKRMPTKEDLKIWFETKRG